MWRRPWPWIALGSLLLFTQANFWLGVAWDDDFDPTRLEAVFTIVVDGLAYLVAIFATVLMGCIQRTGWGSRFVLFLLPARTLAVVLVLGVFAVAAFVALLPGVLIVTFLSTLGERSSAFVDPWPASLELLGRTLLLAVPYALLCALFTLLTRSRIVGAVLCIAYFLAEGMLFDLTLNQLAAASWARGLLLSEVYYYWLGDPDTTLGIITSLLRLENGPQGFLVLGVHTLWLSAAICLLVVNGRRLSDEPPAAGHPGPTPDGL